MGSLAGVSGAVGAKMRGRLQDALARRAELHGGGGDADACAGADATTEPSGPAGAAVSAASAADSSAAAATDRDDARHDWVAQPMHADAAIRAQTGQGWDDWIDAIDAGVGRDATHPQIVEWVMANSAQNGWWSQGIAVSFERMTGRRLAGQMPDGTFTANRTRTLAVDREVLRELIAADETRDALLGFETKFRSRLASKTYKVLIARGDEAIGGLLFTFDVASNGRTKLAIMHEKLQALDEIELWKAYWGDWLDALEAALA
ncbi:hypothetical protein [Pseudoclavibacter helvolus]|uniref:hypothetical protein n=1 Tax=Pseudoclavibacter helvolus TaxID=255205 RepID=UPI0024AD3ABD|nr:hypothetical protein [Pseudoclavibacter helvolus]